MDNKQLIKWLIPVLARGLAWILAARLGLEAAEAQSQAAAAAEALGALALVGVSIYTSLRGRARLAGRSTQSCPAGSIPTPLR